MEEVKHQIDHPNLLAGNPGNDGGRPTKYKLEYCELIIDHMAKGYSVESFAAVCDVSKDTVYEWIKVHPEFSDACMRGLAKSLLFWEALGIKGTTGGFKTFNATVYALSMANKHKWLSARADVTTDGQKIEAPIVYMPGEDKNK